MGNSDGFNENALLAYTIIRALKEIEGMVRNALKREDTDVLAHMQQLIEDVKNEVKIAPIKVAKIKRQYKW
jgi:hypothetical protein